MIHTVLNRGAAAFCSGDLPAALVLLDDAAAGYRALGMPTQALSLARCGVFLAAGLAREALTEADAAIEDLDRLRGQSASKATLLAMAASCALAAAEPLTALDRAKAARRLYAAMQNSFFEAQAGLLILQAQQALRRPSVRLLAAADAMAMQLTTLGSAQAAQAHVLAGRIARDVGSRADAISHFSSAARSRRRRPGYLQACRLAGGSTARRGRTGYAAAAGGVPSRARDSGRAPVDPGCLGTAGAGNRARGRAAALAQRHAARTRQPRLLLAWSERWRATALAVPAVRPPGAGFDADLAAVRQATTRLEDARREGVPGRPVRAGPAAAGASRQGPRAPDTRLGGSEPHRSGDRRPARAAWTTASLSRLSTSMAHCRSSSAATAGSGC